MSLLLIVLSSYDLLIISPQSLSFIYCFALARVPDWNHAAPHYPAVFVPGLANLVPASYSHETQAAASALELLEVSSVVAPLAARVGEERHAAAALNAEEGEAPETLPAFSVAEAQALLVQPAVESAGGSPCCAAGNGSSGCVVYAAAPDRDSDHRNICADRQAAGRALEQTCSSICPIPFVAAPIHGPSADPNEAAHSTATRESIQEAADSSEPGYAGRTAAPPPAPQMTRGHCTRYSRTSYRSGKPSTFHRKRNNWHPPLERSRPDIQV